VIGGFGQGIGVGGDDVWCQKYDRDVEECGRLSVHYHGPL
jgi:hypothetical protein